MNDKNKIELEIGNNLQNAIKYLAFTIAIILGLLITKNANCLWAFFILTLF